LADPQVPHWHHLPPNRFNPHAWIIGDPEIGEGTWIGAFTVIDGSGGLSIGSHCDISAGAQVYTHSTVRRALSDEALPIERRVTRIGNHVHIGAAAVVLMGADIGDHCVVAAGAVVREGTVAPSFSILRGVPATVHVGAARTILGVEGDRDGP
jgi:carbonic anhydrase/acetyltransferase-like protein (isoleucine patch superfamily)